MGHDYGVPLRFLSVTPTRDNEVAPGNRLADKHSRVFHGKTLDEWTMIQLWSSKYCGKAVFVCETEAHRDKLSRMAEKYGIELSVRPREMLHPINDTGGLPINWVIQKELREDYYSLITTPFVITPNRPPGFFDYMVEQYLSKMEIPDYQRTQALIFGAYPIDGACFELDKDGVGHQLGEVYLNQSPILRFSVMNHFMAASWWWQAMKMMEWSRHDPSLHPTIFDIEPWMDIHIDHAEQWDAAEFWFEKKILSQGEDCYERYRSTWHAETENRGHGNPAPVAVK